MAKKTDDVAPKTAATGKRTGTKSQQQSYDRLSKMLEGIENPNTVKLGNKEFLPETLLGGAMGIGEVGYGLAGLFIDEDLGLKPYESTYETSAALPAMRDKALQDATTGGDDYAARIRAKNMYADTVQSSVNRSGGSRSFVQSNVAAAGDAFNLANLGIDKEMEGRRQSALNLASNIENAVTNDKLNKMKDMQYANDDKFRKMMQEITFDRENRQGAMAMIKGGIGNVAQATMNESQWGKNGTMRNSMSANIQLELQRIGGLGGPAENSFQTQTTNPALLDVEQFMMQGEKPIGIEQGINQPWQAPVFNRSGISNGYKSIFE